MALEPLATVADLSAREIDTSNATLAGVMLAAASAAVRDAAGCPITEATSTVKLVGDRGPWLRLPGGPVTAVDTVLIDGAAVTDWKHLDEFVWRPSGWQPLCEPSVVTVTYTHGLAECPDDIVDLVCSLAAAGIAAAAEGYEARTGASPESEAIDDYRVTYSSGEDVTAGPMELPERTRAWLRSRFGGGAYATGVR